MSRKRNEYLDADESEEDIGRDSDVEEDTRLRALPAKRRKLNTAQSKDAEDQSEASGSEQHASDDDDDDEDDDDEAGGAPLTDDHSPHKSAHTNTKLPPPPSSSSSTALKPPTPAQFAASQAKARKTGVIYISRIPPFMKPSAVRSLLSPYGAIERIFLTPEPTPTHQRRVRAGGNKKRSFVDGWVEFASKKKAKIVAETLNGNIVGGKKGGWYHDDIWNIKYLRGFKWADLMEQVQNEEREREGRLRAEIGREAKERKAFLGNLEVQRREKGMLEKRKRKEGRLGDAASAAADEGDDGGEEQKKTSNKKVEEGGVEVDAFREAGEEQNGRKKREMRFRQHEVKDKPKSNEPAIKPSKGSTVSSKIFG